VLAHPARSLYRIANEKTHAHGLVSPPARCRRFAAEVTRGSADLSLEDIVAGGLCIGCGLCRAIAGADKIRIVLTPEGRERRPVGFRDFDAFQPHQVRKKRAVWARLAGMRAAGQAIPQTHNLRLEECALLNTVAQNLEEARGARRRSRQGRLGEPRATER
jgi:hypothetical protein